MKQVKQQALQIIKKHYPNVSEENITFAQGNDHYVFIMNNEVAFRFPKVPRDIDPKRANFLELLASETDLHLPTIEIHKDTETGIMYEVNKFLPGVSFYPSIAFTFSHAELMTIAQKLGGFLSKVHAFPVEKAREINLDEMNPNDFWEYMEQNPHALPKFKKLVYPYVSQEEQAWIEHLFTEYIAFIKQKPFQTRVLHADMWTYHIIVDPENHTLSGVIDFWGRIADPANDFKAFEYYGEDFVKEVYKHYTLPMDEDFNKRRLFYTGHDEVFELARQIEIGDAAKIEQQKHSLSEYIKNHQ
ncbi:MAG TPA: phosphotransferase [Candidatus Saccharimonadales bacterium]|nr:phosphotransferase [Candidatus Saccharimonadales bacterium]